MPTQDLLLRLKVYYARFLVNELRSEDLIAKLNSYLGTPTDDPYTPRIIMTFMALCSISDFEEQEIPIREVRDDTPIEQVQIVQNHPNGTYS